MGFNCDYEVNFQGYYGAGKRVMGKGLMVPSPEKLPDGTQGVAVTPLPTLPTGLWVDSKERKQELAVEAEIYHLGPQDPAPLTSRLAD